MKILFTFSGTSFKQRLLRTQKTTVLRLAPKHFEKKKKVISTRASQAVPHLSTNLALNRLTSEFEWDPVLLA